MPLAKPRVALSVPILRFAQGFPLQSLTQMIEYKSSGRTYNLSYQQLREHHYRFVQMTDEEFMRNIPDALHLACVIGWLKEFGNACLEDTGIIHQLVHLLTVPQCEDLHEIRDLFKTVLNLS